MEPIKFGNLALEYQEIKNEVNHALSRVLDNGIFILGPELENFEKEFAAYLGDIFCTGVGSGTDAIALALKACNVGPGDEVITVAHTAVPTVSAISLVGAIPRFVDCRSDTCLMDIDRLEAKITTHTRAIIPVHLYGQCVDMEPLLQISKQYSIPIIEDCAQAHGARYKGYKAGTMGLVGCFSFYPSKNLGCYGDGGAVVTKDKSLHEKLRMLRNYGKYDRYSFNIKGMNSRLDEIQASILCLKLRYLDKWNSQRRHIAQIYNREFSELPITTPVESRDCFHVYHHYVIQTKLRNSLQDYLKKHGIQTFIHYPIPVHKQLAYSELKHTTDSLPITEQLAKLILSLPVYPQLRENEVMSITEFLRRFFS